MSADIDLRIESSIATVTLTRPVVLNALSFAMWDELTTILEDLEDREDVNCVVLAAQGRHFCSGTDISDLSRHSDLDPGERSTRFEAQMERTNQVFRLLERLPQPVVASVRGVAAGGGFGLVANADLVVASETARFSVATVRLGATPDVGLAIQLFWSMGLKKAKQYCLLGDDLLAAEAAEAGLVNWLVPDGELEAKTAEVAHRVAVMPRPAINLNKASLNTMTRRTLAEQLERESIDVARCVADPQYVRRIEDFLEQRQAHRSAQAPPAAR